MYAFGGMNGDRECCANLRVCSPWPGPRLCLGSRHCSAEHCSRPFSALKTHSFAPKLHNKQLNVIPVLISYWLVDKSSRIASKTQGSLDCHTSKQAAAAALSPLTRTHQPCCATRTRPRPAWDRAAPRRARPLYFLGRGGCAAASSRRRQVRIARVPLARARVLRVRACSVFIGSDDAAAAARRAARSQSSPCVIAILMLAVPHVDLQSHAAHQMSPASTQQRAASSEQQRASRHTQPPLRCIKTHLKNNTRCRLSHP